MPWDESLRSAAGDLHSNLSQGTMAQNELDLIVVPALLHALLSENQGGNSEN